MKNIFKILCIAIIACFAFAGCTHTTEQLPTAGNESEISSKTPEQPSETNPPAKEEITKMYLTINENKIEVTLAENSSADALVEILKQGDIVYTANDYGGFEKVGSLGYNLPANNSQITAQAGDVTLYSGNQIVLFYGSNTWSYTRLGRINGFSASELKTLLCGGNGNVKVIISLD